MRWWRRGSRPPRGTAEPTRLTFEVAWSNYVRKTFSKGNFYAFETLRPELYLYVAENKSLPGREARAEGDALGRSLSVAWFEAHETTDDGVVVTRVDKTSQDALLTMLSSLAEILHAAGEPWPALGPEATARALEVAVEARYAHVPRYIYQATHLFHESDPWTFLLWGADPAETKYLAETPLDELTNMALARQLELSKGQDLRTSWTMSKANLLRLLSAP